MKSISYRLKNSYDFLFRAAWFDERMMMQLEEPINEVLAEKRFNRWAYIYGHKSCLLNHIHKTGWSVIQFQKVLGGALPSKKNIKNNLHFYNFYHEIKKNLNNIDPELTSIDDLTDRLIDQAFSKVKNLYSQTTLIYISEVAWEYMLYELKLKIRLLTQNSYPRAESYLNSSINKVSDVPVLIRLVYKTINDWSVVIGELLSRLSRDAEDIGLTMSSKDVICKIQHFLSDPHNNGHTVDVITFASGRKLVYKPTDLYIHKAFSIFLHELSCLGLKSGIFVPNIIVREGYGWINWVEGQSCKSLHEVKNYFYRIGILLCILYILDGTDIHSENLIAFGCYPTLIDLECLFTNFSNGDMSTVFQPLDRIPKYPIDSVIKTGILPISEKCYLSVLGNFQNQHSNIKSQEHICSLNGISINPLKFLKEINSGFENTYDFFYIHKISIQKIIGRVFENIYTRFSVRPTQLYSLIQKRVLQPKFLADGVDFSIELDVLRASYSKWSTTQKLFLPDKLLNEEYQSIRELDVPIFLGNTSDLNIYLIDKKKYCEDYFNVSAIDMVNLRLNNISINDRAKQLKIVNDSLRERFDS